MVVSRIPAPTWLRQSSSLGDRPSRAWYLLPWFMGLIGGLVRWLVVRDRDEKMGERMWIYGGISSAIYLVLALLVPFLFLGLVAGVVAFSPNAHTTDTASSPITSPYTLGSLGTTPDTLGSSDTTPTTFEDNTPTSTEPSASTTGTASGPSYAITSGVIIRDAPSSQGNQIGSIAAGTYVQVQCITSGETITGPYGDDSQWDRLTYNGTTGYVTDEYVDTKGDATNGVISQC